MATHRPLSSSFLGLPYRILNMNHKKELLRGLWVEKLLLGRLDAARSDRPVLEPVTAKAVNFAKLLKT